jgi:hypothetical protein
MTIFILFTRRRNSGEYRTKNNFQIFSALRALILEGKSTRGRASFRNLRRGRGIVKGFVLYIKAVLKIELNEEIFPIRIPGGAVCL